MDETTTRRATRLVRSLEAAADVATFRSQLLAGIVDVLPADMVSYNEIDHRSGVRLALMEIEPQDGVPPAIWANFERLLHQHPLIEHYAHTGESHSRRISDFLSRREFHRLELYNEFFRLLRLEHQMAVTLPAEPGRVIGLALNRSRGDFSEEERGLLDLLRPHVVQAFRSAMLFERAQLAVSRSPDDPDLPYAVIELDGVGRVLAATPAAEHLIWTYFAQWIRVRHPLPGELGEWVRPGASQPGVPPPPVPLVVERPAGTLYARRLPADNPGSRDRVVLYSVPDTPRDQGGDGPAGRPTQSVRRQLTGRELQVLGALARGLRNAEIADRLGLSPRTVEKHLERIYGKLGVESRTAALAAWAERRGRLLRM